MICCKTAAACADMEEQIDDKTCMLACQFWTAVTDNCMPLTAQPMDGNFDD